MKGVAQIIGECGNWRMWHNPGSSKGTK